MTINRIKLILSAIIMLPAIAFVAFGDNAVQGSPTFDDAEATYKAKCQMCHSPKAEKAFDPAKDDAVLVEIILKGNKESKPPMPGYEAKGMTAEQAQALVAHMKKLRTPAN